MPKRCCSNIKPTLQIAATCILLGASTIAEAQKSKSVLSVEDVNALIPAIEAAERHLFSNLKIDSEAWGETKANLSDPCELWQRTPVYVSSTAWFDGHPGGKARIDVHKQVLEWRNGAAPYVESSYSAGFDGKYGRVVRHTSGHSGETFPLKEAKIVADYPTLLRSSFMSYTGSELSLQFFFNNDEEGPNRRTFSRFFRTAISPDALKDKAFEVALEKFQGVECIKVGLRDQEGGRAPHISYWLDPARGFALLGHDNISIREDGGERVSMRIRVTKLKEVTPGIWWPMEATLISSPLRAGDPYSRTVYRASNVVANDPNFDESIFSVPFPDGYLIDDQVSGKKYRVGEDPNAPKKQQEK